LAWPSCESITLAEVGTADIYIRYSENLFRKYNLFSPPQVYKCQVEPEALKS